MRSEPQIIPVEQIKQCIYIIRNLPVMLDKDLAELYEVKPIRLREQMKRNIKRFPPDFMFQVTNEEVEFLLSQNAIPSKKQLGGHLPYVFTEQGVANLASILTSGRAIEVNIQIMRAFVSMRRLVTGNAIIINRMDRIETEIQDNKIETKKNFELVFKAIEEKDITPGQGIFFDGQTFDAYTFVSDIARSAKKSITLIDNYIDDTVLTLFSKRRKGIPLTILTKNRSKRLTLDVKKYNEQYPPVILKEFQLSHDRFLILDEKIVYHFGASLKDLGSKWFAFSKMDINAIQLLGKLK